MNPPIPTTGHKRRGARDSSKSTVFWHPIKVPALYARLVAKTHSLCAVWTSSYLSLSLPPSRAHSLFNHESLGALFSGSLPGFRSLPPLEPFLSHTLSMPQILRSLSTLFPKAQYPLPKFDQIATVLVPRRTELQFLHRQTLVGAPEQEARPFGAGREASRSAGAFL